LKTFASRKPNSLLPSPSSFAADTTTPYPPSYNSIIISTPMRPIEFSIAPALLYSGKGYITTEENWTTFLVLNALDRRKACSPFRESKKDSSDVRSLYRLSYPRSNTPNSNTKN
jgi:hypothetical protein